MLQNTHYASFPQTSLVAGLFPCPIHAAAFGLHGTGLGYLWDTFCLIASARPTTSNREGKLPVSSIGSYIGRLEALWNVLPVN